MLTSTVHSIAIAPAGAQAMQSIESVLAIAQKGLEGDRYAEGKGTFQKKSIGNRQVTLIDARFLNDRWPLTLTRRNIAVEGQIDLMRLIRYDKRVIFQIGDSQMRALFYCDPCSHPSKLAGYDENFKDTFRSHGGIVAEVLRGGMIRVGDQMSADIPAR